MKPEEATVTKTCPRCQEAREEAEHAAALHLEIAELLGKHVTVTSPDGTEWAGILQSVASTPSVVIDQADGFRVVLPQAFAITETAGPGPQPEQAAGPELPPGEYARVEVMGHDSHTGFVTDGTRAGVPVLRVADFDGRVFVEVPGPALFAFVPLPTPQKRPGPRAAITPGTGWDDDADRDEDEGWPF